MQPVGEEAGRTRGCEFDNVLSRRLECQQLQVLNRRLALLHSPQEAPAPDQGCRLLSTGPASKGRRSSQSAQCMQLESAAAARPCCGMTCLKWTCLKLCLEELSACAKAGGSEGCKQQNSGRPSGRHAWQDSGSHTAAFEQQSQAEMSAQQQQA